MDILQERLATRGSLMGLVQLHPNRPLVELAAESGYDFLFLDGEHGDFSEEDFRQTPQMLAATDVLAMVRLAGHDLQAVRRYVEMGADAIIAPHVSTAEEVRTLVGAMPSQAGACLIVILESVAGVANVEEILSVEGVAGAFVGLNDLTEDLGCRGDYAQPAYAQALARMERAAAASGKLLGTVPHAGYPIETLFARGHRMFVLGADRTLIGEAMSAQLSQAHRACRQVAPRPRPVE